MIFKLVLILQTSFQASIPLLLGYEYTIKPLMFLFTYLLLLQTRIALMIYGLLKSRLIS
jgi:hypothetical protein